MKSYKQRVEEEERRALAAKVPKQAIPEGSEAKDSGTEDSDSEYGQLETWAKWFIAGILVIVLIVISLVVKYYGVPTIAPG